MGRTVLLRHDLPGGSHHFDWLIEPGEDPEPSHPADPDERVLIAWRLPRRLDEALGTDLAAEPLPLHRRLYLDHEGPVSGGRGVVSRVASGRARIYLDNAGAFDAVVELGATRLRVRGRPTSREAWLLRVSRAEQCRVPAGAGLW